mmetsp:Transcript_28466/g.66286  ORF Transcript_28466/g.66286 Transcript_28466/m.66286 type:complete len:230 (-) Transcript_28466:28-717(-)
MTRHPFCIRNLRRARTASLRLPSATKSLHRAYVWNMGRLRKRTISGDLLKSSCRSLTFLSSTCFWRISKKRVRTRDLMRSTSLRSRTALCVVSPHCCIALLACRRSNDLRILVRSSRWWMASLALMASFSNASAFSLLNHFVRMRSRRPFLSILSATRLCQRWRNIRCALWMNSSRHRAIFRWRGMISLVHTFQMCVIDWFFHLFLARTVFRVSSFQTSKVSSTHPTAR